MLPVSLFLLDQTKAIMQIIKGLVAILLPFYATTTVLIKHSLMCLIVLNRSLSKLINISLLLDFAYLIKSIRNIVISRWLCEHLVKYSIMAMKRKNLQSNCPNLLIFPFIQNQSSVKECRYGYRCFETINALKTHPDVVHASDIHFKINLLNCVKF